MRQISIINESTVVPANEFAAAVAAVQVQLNRDFSPAWKLWVTLVPNGNTPERVYVLDDSDQADALGYHTIDNNNNPVGFVFANTDKKLGLHWQPTLSHEVLEQIPDPYTNLTALGYFSNMLALVAYESADPVENDEYLINGVPVSNFVFPSWFEDGYNGRVDFLGRLSQAFTLSPGGYISYQTKLGIWQNAFAALTPHRQRWPHRYSRRHRRLTKQSIME